jgi:hypothetical protein
MLILSLKRIGLAIAFALAGVATASAFPGGALGGGGGFNGGGFAGGGIAGAGVAGGGIPGGGFAGGGIPGGGFAGGGVRAGGLGTISGPVSVGVPFIPSSAMAPQRFRDLNVTGRVGVKPGSQPIHSKTIRLTLDGHEIPMQLDTELQSAELQFNPDDSYARDLYQSILTKRVEVVGRENLRDQIAGAAEQSKPLQIEGYVFDRTSPYLVVKSVRGD